MCRSCLQGHGAEFLNSADPGCYIWISNNQHKDRHIQRHKLIMLSHRHARYSQKQYTRWGSSNLKMRSTTTLLLKWCRVVSYENEASALLIRNL